MKKKKDDGNIIGWLVLINDEMPSGGGFDLFKTEAEARKWAEQMVEDDEFDHEDSVSIYPVGKATANGEVQQKPHLEWR
jgi:hypothetical protein